MGAVTYRSNAPSKRRGWDTADLSELVRQSEIVFSIVASNAAVELAQRVAKLASRSRRDFTFSQGESDLQREVEASGVVL